MLQVIVSWSRHVSWRTGRSDTFQYIAEVSEWLAILTMKSEHAATAGSNLNVFDIMTMNYF